MAKIEVNVDTYVDVDIDVIDVIEECSDSEIIKVLEYLVENDFISEGQKINSKSTYGEIEFNKNVTKLFGLYLQLTPSDWEIIQKIIDKY
jgi:hypothetical protein